MNTDRFKFRVWDLKLRQFVIPDKMYYTLTSGIVIFSAKNSTHIYYPSQEDLIIDMKII